MTDTDNSQVRRKFFSFRFIEVVFIPLIAALIGAGSFAAIFDYFNPPIVKKRNLIFQDDFYSPVFIPIETTSKVEMTLDVFSTALVYVRSKDKGQCIKDKKKAEVSNDVYLTMELNINGTPVSHLDNVVKGGHCTVEKQYAFETNCGGQVLQGEIKQCLLELDEGIHFLTISSNVAGPCEGSSGPEDCKLKRVRGAYSIKSI